MSNHYKTGEIVDIPQEVKDAAKKGASGALGLIGGVLGGVGKTVGAFANTVKQLMPFGKASQQTRRIKSFHRDGVTYDRNMINDAFAKRFGKANNSNPITEHLKRKPEKDALTHPHFNRINKNLRK
ncbi:hypothetical protein CMO95_03625 [Candidatus Woesearchaeota archaeon]|nr:hypothetical protein [Candidatus Woesearchaeota archaeon]|tara:strand:+ start:409 stop:786 length:378 start_codon:yes stop_codon:yes gene_type:complete